MTKKSDAPAIRFKGFSDAWEQRKLGDVVQITMGQSPDGSTYSDEPSDYILVQGNADLQNGWVCPRIWTTQITKKADAGDLIMSVRAPAGAMGKTAYNAVIGRGVAAIKGNEFIYQLLVKMDMDGFWKTLSCGSTFESLNSDNIKNAEVKVPTTAEQVQIGDFFRHLDNLITLHQRKCALIFSSFQALISMMFTTSTFSWEQRKFSDVVATRRGLTYKPSDIRKNGVRVLRSSNIAEDSFVLSDEDVFVVREAVNIDCVRANDILITAANGSSRLVGKHTIISGIPEESAVHGGFMLLGTTKEPHFVNASMGSSWYRRFIELFVAGGNGAIGNLNKNDLDNQDIAIPSEKEQKKIGSFFRQLDNLITLHQRKPFLMKWRTSDANRNQTNRLVL